MPLYDFELIEEREIPELNSRGRLYRHKPTGAELLSIESDDENKSFGISFRTPPSDSTGVAHILEHSVLNGSRKYPVKEPFVELVKGSLKTFVNAFTFPDKTVYPCASQNLQDFYNLIDVYMDAVLHPLIPPHILDQEGWHYELEDLEGEMIYKGVVYNEMKGVYSDPDSLLEDACQQSLFPGHVYGLNSGGDPAVIPNLTYRQFVDFHHSYYHPSNARIYWYGDDDPEERLRRTSEYLKEFQALEVASDIPLAEAFSQPVWVEKAYAVSDEEQAKHYICLNWLLTENADPETNLALNILHHILIGTPASPLRKALIDSGLGDDLVGGGLEWHLRQLSFSTGLKGVAGGDLDKVEKLVEDTLDRLAAKGLDPDTVTASMNTVEFSLRENNTGQFPRGIFSMLKALTTWLHDGDPFALLAFEKPLKAIKTRLDAGEAYFEGLIERYFLGNSHRSTVVLKPDPSLNQRLAEEENARLQSVRARMSEEELRGVIENTKKLKAIQETPDTPEALATLPVLELADLDKENKEIPIEVSRIRDAQVLFHDLFTNGILYLNLGFDLHRLPPEYIPYLNLFADGLVKMGTNKQDFVKLSQRIGQQTGGISPGLFVNTIHQTEMSTAYLMLNGKATVDKTGEMLTIMQEILLETNFDDRERFKQILLESKASLESTLIPSGHSYVNRRLNGKQHEAGWVSEQINGVSQLYFLRQLQKEVEEDWFTVVAKLTEMQQILFAQRALICNVTLEAGDWEQVQPQLAAFVEALPAAAVDVQTWQPDFEKQAEGLSIPAQVNYVGSSTHLYDHGFSLHGSIAVIKNYLRTTYLWEKIRVQGGAYGAMVVFDINTGVLNLLSYRDPNLLTTLDNFAGVPGFLRSLELSDGELTKGIIGAIGEIDAYLLPDAKGYTSMARYLTQFDDDVRQTYRAQILGTSQQDFKDLADVLQVAWQDNQIVVLGSAEAIEQANQQKPGFLTVNQVM